MWRHLHLLLLDSNERELGKWVLEQRGLSSYRLMPVKKSDIGQMNVLHCALPLNLFLPPRMAMQLALLITYKHRRILAA